MPERSGRQEFFWSTVAFVLGAVPIWMLLLGGISAMHSMGMTFADVYSRPPDRSMMPAMMQAIHGFMRSYVPYALLPATVGLFLLWRVRSAPSPAAGESHWCGPGGRT